FFLLYHNERKQALINSKELTKKVPFYRLHKVFFYIQLSNSRAVDKTTETQGEKLLKSQKPYDTMKNS
ncbi:MAG: hypothetical protein U0N64_08190, partial [Blautia caecimuris]